MSSATNPLLIKNVDALVSCDDNDSLYHNVDIYIEAGLIKTIARDIDFAPDTQVINARGCFVYPGLINTHHHFFQAFARNRADLDWTKLSLIEWLDTIYPIFARMDEEVVYQASVVSIADLIKHGCTTAFDHMYNYNKHAGSHLVDRQFEAAELFGMRFVAGRGTNTLPMEEGSTIPPAMCEKTTDYLRDCERLISTFHDPSHGAMRQVAVAPCQIVNCYLDTFVESAALAKQHQVQFHTHLGEGESETLLQRFGLRGIELFEKNGILSENVWLAHGWEFNSEEIKTLASHASGVSHCPAPVFLVGDGITPVPEMAARKLKISLGVDGQASNDNSNLMECIRLAYLLQCLNARHIDYAVPEPYDFLKMATAGGAVCLGRKDIGAIAPGMAADLFGINMQGLENVGCAEDPKSYLAKVGHAQPTEFTVINGRPVWMNGEFPGLDEHRLFQAAKSSFDALYRET